MANPLLDESSFSSIIGSDMTRQLLAYQQEQERIKRLKAAIAQANDPTRTSSPSLYGNEREQVIPGRGYPQIPTAPVPEGVPSLYGPAQLSPEEKQAIADRINAASDRRVGAMDRLHGQKLDNINRENYAAETAYNGMGYGPGTILGQGKLEERYKNAMSGKLRPRNPLTEVAPQPVGSQMTNGQSGFAQGYGLNGRAGGAYVEAPLEVSGGKAAARQRVMDAMTAKAREKLVPAMGDTRSGNGYAIRQEISPITGAPTIRADWNPEALQKAKDAQVARRADVAAYKSAQNERSTVFREKQKNPLNGLGLDSSNPLSTAIGISRATGLPLDRAFGVASGMARQESESSAQKDTIRAAWAAATPEVKRDLERQFPWLATSGDSLSPSAINLTPYGKATLVDNPVAAKQFLDGVKSGRFKNPDPNDVAYAQSLVGPQERTWMEWLSSPEGKSAIRDYGIGTFTVNPFVSSAGALRRMIGM